ncbi:hypothetical protein [Aquitalea denitrificans]|uniref:hypothetical protein n=1 Tax=Aquitalea denitrificans TaxID=519081 RepID=UPI00135A89EA|nr:hypothetical protein [Aquitalea denitrificans]
MSAWTLNDLRRLDRKYAEEGIVVHQRPFRAAMELLGSGFVMSAVGNPDVKRIMDAYAAMVPEVETSWPGAGIGVIASIDQVRKALFPIVFGTVTLEPWQMAGFSSAKEWWNWCRQDLVIAAEVAFASADLHDFTMGLNNLVHANPDALTLWQMSRSNLEDAANTLPSTFSHDSVIQPICMVAELSMKAALVWDGIASDSFKGRDGHNLVSLAQRMAVARPHRDDARVQAVVASLPPYVASRYKPAGLKRLQVIRLALGVQFVAASSLRRITDADLAIQMEEDDWPGPRPAFIA